MIVEGAATPLKIETSKAEHELARRLGVVSWGLFFVWLGYAFLADVGWGVGLIGVGVITLGEQAARALYRLGIEAFWFVVGTLFVLGGAWELLNVKVEIVPVLLIALGVTMLGFGLSGKHLHKPLC